MSLSGFKAQARASGDVLEGRYRLERILGEGGMGVVWAATEHASGRRVAIKLLKRIEPEQKKRFFREARIASALRHPNIVHVDELLELDDGAPAMVMDLLTGESLAERLARVGRLPLGELASLVTEVASAVGAAHARGVVHRDLKPENIFLASGPPPSVKVLDFGIAKLTAAEGEIARTAGLTNTGAVMGTPYYMAPEQVFGERAIDHLADVWALGVILYEALSGVRPLDGENFGQIFKAITMGEIVPLEQRCPELPPAVSQLVMRMLSRDKRRRPSGLTEICTVFAPLGHAVWQPFDEARDANGPSRSVPPLDPLGKTETPDALVMAAPAGHVRAASKRSSLGIGLAVAGVIALLAGGGGAAAWRMKRAGMSPASASALSAGTPANAVAASAAVDPSSSAAPALTAPSLSAPSTSPASSASSASSAAPAFTLASAHAPPAPASPAGRSRASAGAGAGAPRAAVSEDKAKLPAGIHGTSPY